MRHAPSRATSRFCNVNSAAGFLRADAVEDPGQRPDLGIQRGPRGRHSAERVEPGRGLLETTNRLGKSTLVIRVLRDRQEQRRTVLEMQVEGLPRHARRLCDIGEGNIGAPSFHNQPKRRLADPLPGRRVTTLRT